MPHHFPFYLLKIGKVFELFIQTKIPSDVDKSGLS